MNPWYDLTNDLETEIPPLDQEVLARITCRARPKRRLWKPLAVAAAILLLTACGYAVARFTPWFPRMTADDQSEDLLAAMGTVIGQTQQAGDYTATLHGAIYDGQNLFLSVSLTGLEDHPNSFRADSGSSWLSYEGVQEALAADFFSLGTFPCTCAGSTATLLIESAFTVAENRALVLHLENVTIGEETVPGPFRFTFTPEPKDVTETWTGTWQVGETTITEIRLTPLEIRLLCHGAGEPPVIDRLQCADGSTLAFPASGNHVQHNDDGTWQATIHMGPAERVYDPKTVTGIWVNGELLN